MKLVSVVTPVYNEVEGLPEFINRLSASLNETGLDWEVVFCVDPSTDGTEQLLRDRHQSDKRIKLIRFSRRFGQPAATMAGIHSAGGDAVIVIDADLQDPPELIPELVKEWLGGAKIVLAERRSRTGEPYAKKLISNFGYNFMNRFSEIPIPRNTGDFRLLDRQVCEELKKFSESNLFLRGLVSLVGFETKTILFDRPERFKGVTKYNKWVGSLKIGLNGIVGYSTALLNMSTIFGLFFSTLAIMLGTSYALAKFLGVGFPIGNATVVTSVLLMGGLNLLFMGVLGLYISRIYDDVKNRPKYIIEEKLGLE
jgi:dolichol-phosphate mannosyltransferase